LAGDVRGVSAVEFALIAPVMILFYAGMVDLCQGYMALKRTSHASAVADLASQSRSMTKARHRQHLRGRAGDHGALRLNLWNSASAA
jgi:Flp pilus assembly protein TadG